MFNDSDIHYKAFWPINGVFENAKLIDLSNNYLIHLNSLWFHNVPELETVLLDYNGIESIEVDLFTRNEKLKIIILRRNRISRISFQFGKLKYLRLLNLELNQLASLKENIFLHIFSNIKRMSYNEGVILYSNKFTCGCDMKWLYITGEYEERKIYFFFDTELCLSNVLNDIPVACIFSPNNKAKVDTELCKKYIQNIIDFYNKCENS